jgi:anti-anti-sigma regulatory factor
VHSWDIAGDVLSVSLPKEPRLSRELAAVNQLVCQKGGLDVVLDFSLVELISSASIANIVILNNVLSDFGRKVVLCKVRLVTKCAFTRLGLDAVLSFTHERSDALAVLEKTQLVLGQEKPAGESVAEGL